MKTITGIQQMGVGVKNAAEAWKWYRKMFGMDIKVFESVDVAELMLPHTEGKARNKYAALALNLEGGGGFEIWEHRGHEPRYPDFELKLGDLGIFITKMKTRDAEKAFAFHKEQGVEILGQLSENPAGIKHYFVVDPYNNIFEIVEEPVCYKKQKSVNGGVYGAIVGCSDIEKSLVVYQDILAYDEIIYDQTEIFSDFAPLNGGEKKCRRVLLRHSKKRIGPFSKMLGPSQIELVQVFDGEPRHIYENRIWGEPGFIHLCFDIVGMNDLKKECAEKGHAFTVDSNPDDGFFEMGKAGGRFTYIEDPDGGLIEFVETKKLPIIEKLGIYMPIKGTKSLPNWMINTLAWGRIKD